VSDFPDFKNLADYNPNRLFDVLRASLKLKNDTDLARLLGVGAPVISKIRHRRLRVAASLLIRMHEVCGIEIGDLRDLMGDRRRKFRIGDSYGRFRRDIPQ
jgi:transcriptional regulator with XRE-family HTH domain